MKRNAIEITIFIPHDYTYDGDQYSRGLEAFNDVTIFFLQALSNNEGIPKTTPHLRFLVIFLFERRYMMYDGVLHNGLIRKFATIIL